MTMDDFKTGVFFIVMISIIPSICLFLTFKDDIFFYFKKERAKAIDVSGYSMEVQKLALYLEKLTKVYNLCRELDIDAGNYFGLTKKVSQEIDYIESKFNTQLGKDTREKMMKNKEDTP